MLGFVLIILVVLAFVSIVALTVARGTQKGLESTQKQVNHQSRLISELTRRLERISPSLPPVDSAKDSVGEGIPTQEVEALPEPAQPHALEESPEAALPAPDIAQPTPPQAVETGARAPSSYATHRAREASPTERPKTATPLKKFPVASFRIDWEKFTGARLFGWIGGLALFLGMAFLAKYSIDQGLLSPAVRVGIGSLAGIGSVLLGMRLGAKGYSISQHTLCAAGTAVLYAMVYASYDLYGFFGPGLAFPLMILITVVAFSLSIRLESKYMALVGLAGGFLTPWLVSSGEDNPVGLFAYIALLDIGLAGLVWKRRWDFLFPLSAAATTAVLLGWTATFFNVDKALTAVTAWGLFPILFGAFTFYIKRGRQVSELVVHTAGSLSLTALSFGFFLLFYPELGTRPGLLFGFMFLISLVLAGLSVLDRRFYYWQMGGGGLVFLALMVWTSSSLNQDLLGWGLGLYLLFAVLHSVFPIVLQRIRPPFKPLQLSSAIFPLLMLMPLIHVVATDADVSLAVWLVVLLINAVALVCAFTLGIAWIATAFLAATLVLVWMRLLSIPAGADPSGSLWLVTFFSLAFFGLGLLLSRNGKQLETANGETGPSPYSWSSRSQLSIFSALLPFLLLATTVIRLPLADPFQVFGLAALLVLLMFGLVYFWKVDDLSLLSLAGVALLEAIWYLARFDSAAPSATLFWNTCFWLLFLLFPFFLPNAFRGRRLLWWASALAGPVHLFLVYAAVSQSMGTAFIGLLPAAFALVYLLALNRLARTIPKSLPERVQHIALFAGTTLFLVTLIFALQFEKQWLTVSWALEGVALLWLYHRISYSQLKHWAAALLTISFVRLALNPEVFFYQPRGDIPILNWYLYGYGIVLTCLAVAARFWRPKEENYWNLPVRATLYGMSTVLAFLLLNIEITDYFSTGPELTFQFGKSLAQDLSYSLAWALFGLVMLLTGIHAKSKAPRLAGLALILVTTAKLFLYDLWYLEQLYRVVAFVGLAVVLVIVSFLYQRYLGADQQSGSGNPSRSGQQDD
jgi:uncharacterized membrane protein